MPDCYSRLVEAGLQGLDAVASVIGMPGPRPGRPHSPLAAQEQVRGVLHAVASHPGQSIYGLASATGWALSDVAAALAVAEHGGAVRLEPGPTNGERAYLTDAGRRHRWVSTPLGEPVFTCDSDPLEHARRTPVYVHTRLHYRLLGALTGGDKPFPSLVRSTGQSPFEVALALTLLQQAGAVALSGAVRRPTVRITDAGRRLARGPRLKVRETDLEGVIQVPRGAAHGAREPAALAT